MPTITIKPSGKTQEVAEGSFLIDAIKAAGFEVNCTIDGPKHMCDVCHIFVVEGKKTLAKTSKEEAERLDNMIGVGSKSRFACQAQVGTEPVTIELLGALSG
jgi:2Fe-2S ferredoxin